MERVTRTGVVVLALLISIPSWVPGSSGSTGSGAPRSLSAESVENMLLHGSGFIENAGQVANDGVRYYVSMRGVDIGFMAGATLFNVAAPTRAGESDPLTGSNGVLVRAVFEGSNPVVPVGRNPLPYGSNFFIGNDPARWRTGVPSYREIVYEDLYPGIDLAYRLTEAGAKYEFLVRPGAAPSAISIRYDGADAMAVDSQGSLVVRTEAGVIHDAGLKGFQAGRPVACWFALRDSRRIGVSCEGTDPSRPLTIDPLVYSTFVGGSRVDETLAIAADSSGSAYVVGATNSPDFPVTPGAFGTTHTSEMNCGFVVKLNPTGSALEYATYLCGSHVDHVAAVAVDAAGNAYLTGEAGSSDFPTTPGAFDRTNGGIDAFVTKLNPSGSALAYSTFLGGSEYEKGWGIAVDATGAAFVVGGTTSPDFPATPGAADTTCGTDGRCNPVGQNVLDGFLAKLNPAGSALIYATFIGGSDGEWAYGLALDPSGDALVTGDTVSVDLPATPGSFQTFSAGDHDAYVVRVSAAGDAFLFLTYLGGREDDGSRSIALDPSGAVYVAGTTQSPDFPTTPGAFDRTCGVDGSCDPDPELKPDGFAAKLTADGRQLVYSTYLGGHVWDRVWGLGVDASGRAYLSGDTSSPDFPTTSGSFDRTFHGIYDAFVASLGPSGDVLEYGSFLGGARTENYARLALDPAGGVYVSGSTMSGDYPVTPGAFDTLLGSETWDVFVTKLDLAVELNHPPALAWTGESNYVGDGLDPEVGTTGTSFSYRVAYSDPDNDPPTAVRITVHRPLGTAWRSFNLSFVSWVGSPFNYTAGAVYDVTTKLTAPGTDYWYVFNATDGRDWASGPPTVPVDAPDVTLDNPPHAIARATPVVASVGDPITFDGTGSTDDHGIIAYLWDFGDGATGTNAVATHAYSTLGPHVATLTVWDTANQTGTASVSVTTVLEVAPGIPVFENWKPIVALAFAVVLVLAGVLSSRRRPWRNAAGRESAYLAFLLTSLPFVLAEIATGIASSATGFLSIPPVVGPGSLVDGTIVVGGIAVAVLRLLGAEPRRTRSKTEREGRHPDR